MQNQTIIRVNDVLSLTGLKSRTTLWRRLRAGKFPEPVDLGGGQIGWIESDVQEWIASRPRRTYR